MGTDGAPFGVPQESPRSEEAEAEEGEWGKDQACCASEDIKRPKNMHKRPRLEGWLGERIAAGALKRPEKIGAAVDRIMQRYHGYRYFDRKLKDGSLEFSEGETRLGRERRIEGKYVITAGEEGLSVRVGSQNVSCRDRLRLLCGFGLRRRCFDGLTRVQLRACERILVLPPLESTR